MSPTPDLESPENVPDESGRAVPIACSLLAEQARDRVERWSILVVNAKTSARAQAGLVQAEFRNETAVHDLSETETVVGLTITPLSLDAIEDLAIFAPAIGSV